MITVSILGYGNRGRRYGNALKKHNDAKITAVCDINPKFLKLAEKAFSLDSGMLFGNEDDFFKQGKLSDALVIASQDRDHYRHAISALNLGYHLLLEKPVSPVYAECEEIYNLAKEKNLKIMVCHVLRYSPFYDAIKKIIVSGEIGDVVSIHDTENIAYWHYAHSYVRGNWGVEENSSPSILAKCCHDLDILYYFAGSSKAKSVFSVASRTNFTPENAPEGATDYCLSGCPHRKTCVYDSAKQYYKPTLHSFPLMGVNIKLVTGMDKPRLKHLKQALKTSRYGRCVYKCGANVMEDQLVGIKFENGVNASLKMTAFSNMCFRQLHICGTKGEIIGKDLGCKLKVNVFGGKKRKVKIKGSNVFNHHGGDTGIVNDFIEYLKTGNKTERLSTMEVTLESHRIASLAEESRKR
ncbi:MAG: Gfo/Idh/MocA family oxidoreductase [Firmicutes bacterium]|nr:Gfo/Idh/MocA family oxidoreductase [Bacillota bacterium]